MSDDRIDRLAKGATMSQRHLLRELNATDSEELINQKIKEFLAVHMNMISDTLHALGVADQEFSGKFHTDSGNQADEKHETKYAFKYACLDAESGGKVFIEDHTEPE